MNLYCVLGSVGLITPLHIASEPIVFHANPRRCKAARTLVLRRLLSRITPFPPFWLPLNGYRVPHEPAHQKSCFKGFPAVDETASAVHAAAGNWVCYCRRLWIGKKSELIIVPGRVELRHVHDVEIHIPISITGLLNK